MNSVRSFYLFPRWFGSLSWPVPCMLLLAQCVCSLFIPARSLGNSVPFLILLLGRICSLASHVPSYNLFTLSIRSLLIPVRFLRFLVVFPSPSCSLNYSVPYEDLFASTILLTPAVLFPRLPC
jgi:hypothetical protein